MAKKFNLADYVQPVDVSESDTPELRDIPLSKLLENGRNHYGIRNVEELAESIALNGQIEPLVVYPCGAGDLYRLISGHRRLAALRYNKAETARCLVIPKPESTAREDLLIIQANAQRVKTPGELAEEAQTMTAALVALKKEGVELPGRLRDAVADAMGVSSSKLGRIQAIENNLRVPGFRQAWKDGKLPEAAAYELSQLNESDQYAALDLLIDEGINYEKADIKAVQRVKKRVALGESPAQDLAAQAEKLGIEIREGDYSPLFAYYVADIVPQTVRDNLRGEGKAEGVRVLHDWGMMHSSAWGGEICYDSDPSGLTLRKPIGKRLKWAEVWELLAMSALAASAGTPHPSAAPTPSPQGEGSGGASPSPTETTGGSATPEGWNLCSEAEPEEGQLVCILWDEGDGCEDWFAHVAVYTGGQYMEFGWSTIAVDAPDGAIWAPLSGDWHELGTKAKREANR